MAASHHTMSHCLTCCRPGEEDLNEDQQGGAHPARDPPARRGRSSHLPLRLQSGLAKTEPLSTSSSAGSRQQIRWVTSSEVAGQLRDYLLSCQTLILRLLTISLYDSSQHFLLWPSDRSHQSDLSHSAVTGPRLSQTGCPISPLMKEKCWTGPNLLLELRQVSQSAAGCSLTARAALTSANERGGEGRVTCCRLEYLQRSPSRSSGTSWSTSRQGTSWRGRGRCWVRDINYSILNCIMTGQHIPAS